MSCSHDLRRPPTVAANIDWPGPALGLDAGIAAIGSCFAQEIAGRLLEAGFSGAQNPNGIVYNAVSMADAVERAVSGPPYSEPDFFEHDGLWHSWSHHGAFSSSSHEEAAEKAEKSRLGFLRALKECGLFIATPASSAVYELLPDGPIVANCHKVPGGRFRRRLLSPDENLAALRRMLAALRLANPSCLAVITLSPVRHYPGDLVLNARSKAHLLSAIHLACESHEGVRYFPAYEIVMDELRDYRFFKEDMLHPNETATEIVLRAFALACFGEGALELLDRAAKARRASAHRRRELE